LPYASKTALWGVFSVPGIIVLVLIELHKLEEIAGLAVVWEYSLQTGWTYTGSP
jgi:hypothetical protein